ncbi:hypothetical protein LQQ51_27815 [Klebsiella pneumoniae]|nr:hypothetical protein [Klebsiella pneumoniae]MCD1153380.1 hypothetical protein [Klebsiella pneumoniae]MCD1158710.1 hypothetical protein [Klebsiella pneumoniae]
MISKLVDDWLKENE